MKISFLQRLGGRKFLLALIVIGVGSAIEIYTKRGMSTAFATLLASIVAAFSASNYAVTREHFKCSAAGSEGSVNKDVREIKALVQTATSPEAQKETIDTVQQIRYNIEEVKNLTEQMGQTMISVANTTQNTQKLLNATLQQR